MKQLKVSDEVYLRIKGYADSGYRSLGSQVELLLDRYEEIKKVQPRSLGAAIHEDRPVSEYIPTYVPTVIDGVFSKNQGGTENPEASKPERARKAQIVIDINEYQKKIDAADLDNQDPDYWDVIRSYKAKIEELWKEWHTL